MAAIASILFFDLGGVVLSNAWDHRQRAAAAAQFCLDPAEFEARHARLGPEMECGRLSLPLYLDQVVFDRARDFTRGQFRQFMFDCSQPLAGTLALLAELAAAGRQRLATLNNEGADLNAYRIEHFGLRRYFSAFCSSCYLGARKPGEEIYRRALGIVQVEPAACLFIDDREENLAAPRALGMVAIHFESAAQLRAEFVERGLL